MARRRARINLINAIEVTCWLLGGGLATLFLSQVVMGEVRRVEGIERAESSWLETSSPDQSLWSDSRIASYRASLETGPEPVLAILELPSLGLKAPVYADELERGPGWIAGTARPGERGNVGIAGHRDGYFRQLENANLGDVVTLRAPGGLEHYVIEAILIVDPVDVEVLEETGEPTLTLVTCYPFYYVGSAPQRFIIRARPRDASGPPSLAQAGSAIHKEI